MYTGDIDGNGKTDLIISGLFKNKISWFSYQMGKWRRLSGRNIFWMIIFLFRETFLSMTWMEMEIWMWCWPAWVTNQMIWYKNKLNETPTTTTIIPSTTTTVPPTIIKLSYFAATPKAGKVILQWNTEAEIDNAGFNIYRAESETGKYIRINDSIVPAKGLATQGASYEFIDTDVKNRNTYYYKLEDIDLNGTSTMHGPVSATPRLLVGILK